jgi:virginiamycin A acetyltransferase
MANFFHDTVNIGKFSSIEVSEKGTNTFIGENCFIDDFVKIKHVGGNQDIRIGKNVYINSGTVIYSGNGITIGNNVLIGPNCNLVPVNHNFSDINQPIISQGFQASKGGIIIEENVWLGANVTVLDGAIIRKGVVVAANSLVKGVLMENGIYGGNPIRKINERR